MCGPRRRRESMNGRDCESLWAPAGGSVVGGLGWGGFFVLAAASLLRQ